MAGDLNVNWIHGSPGCVGSTDPLMQVHRYDADTYILRQGKCSDPPSSHEGPFMYVLIGKRRALLLDSGASSSPAVFPLAKRIRELLRDHASVLGAAPVPLVVAHSHGHGDHKAGDDQFDGDPGVRVIPTGVDKVQEAFGLSAWPEGVATFELGDRTLDIMPVPGHAEDHIAVFDRRTGLLLTGDTVYPGLLVIRDWGNYRRSIARLKAFADAHPVTFVLGAHIEMTNRPGHWFGQAAAEYQPGEHVLQLEARHLAEIDATLQAVGARPRSVRKADYIIHPAGQPDPDPAGQPDPLGDP